MRFYEFEGDPALEATARALDLSGDFRVLRRLPQMHELWVASAPAEGRLTRLAIIDSETTGLGDGDRMIEFAMVKMAIDGDGQLCDITYPIEGLEDPGMPLRPAIVTITGLDDGMLAGQRFDEDVLRDQLADVDAILAFNAGFDALLARAVPLDHAALDLRAEGHRLACAGLCRTLADGAAGGSRLLL